MSRARSAFTLIDLLVVSLEAGLAFPFELEEATVHLSASVGIALAGGRDADAEALIRGAAQAMRDARARGGARYEVYRAN